MSTPYDSLEERLRSLRPARLPGAARRNIARQMQPAGHYAGWPLALAAALTLAVGGIGWYCRRFPQAVPQQR